MHGDSWVILYVQAPNMGTSPCCIFDLISVTLRRHEVALGRTFYIDWMGVSHVCAVFFCSNGIQWQQWAPVCSEICKADILMDKAVMPGFWTQQLGGTISTVVFSAHTATCSGMPVCEEGHVQGHTTGSILVFY